MRIVVLGLSITSSWGNGHATTYRALLKGLFERGHSLLFLERDQPWYAQNRDAPRTSYCETALYRSLDELKSRYGGAVAEADCVIVGSYVPEGIAAGKWVTNTAEGVTVFYDIDTPVTLSQIRTGTCEYLSSELIPRFDRYLSFTGGPILDEIEHEFGSPSAHPFYCCVDPAAYFPTEDKTTLWDLGYLGTYSDDRQPALEKLLLEPSRRVNSGKFAVAGSLYPDGLEWPANVERIAHLPPGKHRHFYNSQRFTLNVTRAAMVQSGYSPSVRLFEAAACGVPIISDYWPGLETFLEVGKEILVPGSSEEAVEILTELPDKDRMAMAGRARDRILAGHTAAHRAEELETIIRGAAYAACGELQESNL